jgi:WD40 repeat protein
MRRVRNPHSRSGGLGVGVILAVMAVLSGFFGHDARACGLFVTRPMTEAEIAEKLPYLAVERVLLVWDATSQTEDFVREARFEKANQSFGFVVPVPSRPEVFGVGKAPFDDLARAFPYESPPASSSGKGGAGLGIGLAAAPAPVVLSQQRIGSFTAFVLAATDAGGLAAWLTKNGFEVPAAANAWLDHFVRLRFYYVAFRYDALSVATTGMTSETVRIRFKTPMPYYPYLEPKARGAPRGPRDLLLWYASQEERAPVASARTSDGTLTWKQPWDGRVRRVTAKDVRDALPSLGELVPGDDASPWVVSAFRDEKESREGWGDVLLVPIAPVSIDDGAIASRWPLLPVLDPRLAGDLDEKPIAAAAFEPSLPPPPAGASPAPSATPPSADDASSHGCQVAHGSSAGVTWQVAVVLACLSLLAMKRRRWVLAVAAIVALAACKRGPALATAGPTPAPVSLVLDPGGSVVAFTRDGSQLLVAEEANNVRVHDVASGKERKRFNVFLTGRDRIRALVPLADGRVLVDWMGDERGMLSLYEVESGHEVWREAVDTRVESRIAVSPDGHRALVAATDGSLRAWDIDARVIVRTIPGAAEGVTRMAFLSGDRALTVSPAKDGAGNAIRVWDLARGVQQFTFEDPFGQVFAVAVTPDATRAVTLSDESALRVWDIGSGRELFSMDVYGVSPIDVLASRDGRRAFTLHRHGDVCAWDLAAGARIGCAHNGDDFVDEAFGSVHTEALPNASAPPAFALSPDERLAAFSGLVFYERAQGFSPAQIYFSRVPDGAASAAPVPWPRVPPWSAAQRAPAAAPIAGGDRAAREQAVLSLMFGRTSVKRIPVDAVARIDRVNGVRSVGPIGNALVGAITALGNLPANAERVVAALRPGFRACYNQGLQFDPTMTGKVVVSAKVSPNGEVDSADTIQNTGLSNGVVQCILRKVRNAQFDAPGPASTLQFPITFARRDP